MGVGAAGGATKATVANVLKATRPRASERSGGKGLVDQGAAREQVETFHGSGADRLERKKDYPRAVGEKKPTPLIGTRVM